MPAHPRNFTFLAGRLWLDFVNTDDARLGARLDTIEHFDRYVEWLRAAEVVETDRAASLRRRAAEQPSGASAALVEARRIRTMLRTLAERGHSDDAMEARRAAVIEMNRVLGRAVGARRIEETSAGSYVRSFTSVGDAFGGLIIPIIESAVDSLVAGELARVHRCADRRCPRVFLDQTKSRTRRWCEMATCGNRAKAQRVRTKGRRV